VGKKAIGSMRSLGGSIQYRTGKGSFSLKKAIIKNNVWTSIGDGGGLKIQ
jgi:hypothetical protein